jgi:CDGSH-type Zn-finger protein
MMSDVKITVSKNGPLRVEGTVDLMDADGTPIPTPGPQFALCRCGASTRKPFCDGTHSKIGFDAAAKIVPGSKE